MHRLILAARVLLLGLCACATSMAHSETWPSRPIHWVIPYSAGGTSDTLTRIVAQKLSERLGQPVIVDNRAGAGGNIGTDFVAKAAPDGYTMVLGNIGPMAINQSLYASLPYDPVKDFTPITLLMSYGNVILANPAFPPRNIRELIDYAKTHQLSYAGNGIGTSAHLTGELLAHDAGIHLTHIPYKGEPPGMADTMAGVVPLAISSMASTVPLVKSGKLRAIAVTSPERCPAIPDVPTVSESGLPGFQVTGWVGVLVPKGTPDDVVARLVKEFTAIMQTPDVRNSVAGMGSYVPELGPTYFAQFIQSESARWKKVVEEAGIKAR